MHTTRMIRREGSAHTRQQEGVLSSQSQGMSTQAQSGNQTEHQTLHSNLHYLEQLFVVESSTRSLSTSRMRLAAVQVTAHTPQRATHTRSLSTSRMRLAAVQRRLFSSHHRPLCSAVCCSVLA